MGKNEISINQLVKENQFTECFSGHKVLKKTYEVFGCVKCQRIMYEEMMHPIMKVGTTHDNFELYDGQPARPI